MSHYADVDEIEDLKSRLARLEDLRRWRPMSELPADNRWVIARQDDGRDESWWSGREVPGVVYYAHTSNAWKNEHRQPFRPHPQDVWTYIPGQEPKEEV